MAERKKIFIVHHESDRNEKELVYNHLAPYEKIGLLKFWCTSNILPGQNIFEEIDKALKDVKAAIPLISIDFLNKKLDSQEMEIIFANHRKNGLKLFPILVCPCIWETVNWLEGVKINFKFINFSSLIYCMKLVFLSCFFQSCFK